jgi:hypothetical protein
MTPRGRLMTTKEACAYLKCSRAHLSLHASEIGVVRQAGRNLYWESDLERWVQRDYHPSTLPEPKRATPPLSVVGLGTVNPVSGRPWDWEKAR